MIDRLRRRASVTVSHDADPGDALVAGFSAFGLAGLTAVDYLVDHLELEETGHVAAEGLPSITPFAGGRPRHPTRLYSRPELDVTVLVNELFVPPAFAEEFAGGVLEWTAENGVSEVAVLSGVPVAHGPSEHRTFYVATDDFREARLADADLPPMGTGFLDGTKAALVERGLTSPLGVGVLVTPVHAQTPDVDAAVRLVGSVADLYDLEVDPGPLQEFAAEVQQYYSELAERMEAPEVDRPEDRMYM